MTNVFIPSDPPIGKLAEATDVSVIVRRLLEAPAKESFEYKGKHTLLVFDEPTGEIKIRRRIQTSGPFKSLDDLREAINEQRREAARNQQP